MSAVFSRPPPPPPPAPPAPTRDDPAVEAARRRAVIAARHARGRSATVLTGNRGLASGAGLPGDTPISKKTLLGA
ncbi:MAG: hypothetical protein ABJ215_01185 [Alphaproteobacteria bacterium]